MGAEDVPQCQHLKVNGERCGSPALRRRRRCYFHEEVRIDRAKAAGDHFAQRRFQLPVLEDANAVQVGLMKVIEMLGYGRMEPRVAGLILYALQTVSYNLRYTNLEPGTGPKVAIDSQRNRRDGSGTRAPHWLMRDSVDALQESVQEPARDDAPEYDAIEAESREKVNNDQVAAGSRKVAAEVAADPAAMARRANREKVRRTVEGLLRNYVLDTMGEAASPHPD
jgi:hypothetical protein